MWCQLGANVELSSADAVADGDRSVILDLMWEVVDACVLRRMVRDSRLCCDFPLWVLNLIRIRAFQFPEAASGRQGLLEWVQVSAGWHALASYCSLSPFQAQLSSYPKGDACASVTLPGHGSVQLLCECEYGYR